MNMRLAVGIVFSTLLPIGGFDSFAMDPDLSVRDFASIQEAIDRNPGKMIYVPSGDYEISDPIRITGDGSGLFGYGRIIQTNSDAEILVVKGTKGVRIKDLTLTRPEGKMETTKQGVESTDSENTVFDGIQLINNRGRSSSLAIRGCTNAQVLNCLVLNYSRIAVDDRTPDPVHWGYAFNCIDGTGIGVTSSKGTLLQGNRIIEKNMLPTPELKEKYNLGSFVKQLENRGSLIGQEAWDSKYVNNWHQGSALFVSSPAVTDYTRIIGNHIENAAQGIDIHSDHVIIANNTVNNAFMGMKAMHGSRNVVITGNQFSRIDLWAIGLMPGAAANPAIPASEGQPAKEANCDGGHIIASNIISDFGYGTSHWIWGNNTWFDFMCTPIVLLDGQEADDPPLRDVIVTDNVVYDTGRDRILKNGVPEVEPPRYKYAIYVSPGRDAEQARLGGPSGVHIANNIFHPGTSGISNVNVTN